MADATVKVSLADVEPVRDLLVAGIRLYEALYHMPGATEFFTRDDAPRAVLRAYSEMGSVLRRSPLAIVKSEHEETA